MKRLHNTLANASTAYYVTGSVVATLLILAVAFRRQRK
jgi:hypothetical protein